MDWIWAGTAHALCSLLCLAAVPRVQHSRQALRNSWNLNGHCAESTVKQWCKMERDLTLKEMYGRGTLIPSILQGIRKC